jgi:hypothetical protein
MKKSFVSLCVLAVAIVHFAVAQETQESATLKGQSFNGATGLYYIPSGRIGWERASNLGLDFGYRAIINKEGHAHIPAVTASLFKWVELSGAFDIQHDIKYGRDYQRNDDLLFGVKVRLPTHLKNLKNPAIAVGSSFQFLNISDHNDIRYNAFQPYVAMTYQGTFFTMPAETSIVFGKTFLTGSGRPDNNSDIDFGMGFDLILFPDVLQNSVHWIIDFANFGYSNNSWPNNLYQGTGSAWYRGVVNTGLRIDLASIPALNKFKFAVDLVFNDLFDHKDRSFTIGAVFGFSAESVNK